MPRIKLLKMIVDFFAQAMAKCILLTKPLKVKVDSSAQGLAVVRTGTGHASDMVPAVGVL